MVAKDGITKLLRPITLPWLASDGIGYMGAVTQYAVAILFSSMAVVFFIYFYRKGVSSFDEEAKMEMFNDE